MSYLEYSSANLASATNPRSLSSSPQSNVGPCWGRQKVHCCTDLEFIPIIPGVVDSVCNPTAKNMGKCIGKVCKKRAKNEEELKECIACACEYGKNYFFVFDKYDCDKEKVTKRCQYHANMPGCKRERKRGPKGWFGHHKYKHCTQGCPNRWRTPDEQPYSECPEVPDWTKCPKKK